ncbi:MAG: hypothetical protein ACKVOE_01450 [Rickettsiales bacterium]
MTAATMAMPRGGNIFTARQWRGRPYLISPVADFLMVGGLALILIVLMAFWVPRGVINDVTALSFSPLLAALLTYHIFAINYPHFAYSYQIAYRRMHYIRAASGLRRIIRWRYAFALVIFPILYVAYCAYALALKEHSGLVLLGLLINLMYFTVGWHYCKQSFGILLVLSALKGLYFTSGERRVLLVHAVLAWLMAWLGGNIYLFGDQFWGLPYHSAGLSRYVADWQLETFHTLGVNLTFMLGVLCAVMLVRSAYRARKFPSLTGALGYYMMYPLMLVSSVFHPLWLWVLPAMHSLQYLLFVFAYRRGEVVHMLPEQNHPSPAPSLRLHAIAGFAALGVLIGAIQFSWLPNLLDALVNPDNKLHVPLLFMALCQLFVNIHHYFIDNVIWRRENPEVGRYLMGRG